jgi:hypothetical protein
MRNGKLYTENGRKWIISAPYIQITSTAARSCSNARMHARLANESRLL